MGSKNGCSMTNVQYSEGLASCEVRQACGWAGSVSTWLEAGPVEAFAPSVALAQVQTANFRVATVLMTASASPCAKPGQSTAM